jgi:hypothetical protein
MGRRTGERRPVTHWPQKRDRIERSAPVLCADSGRWTPFRTSLLSLKGGRADRSARGRTVDGSLRRATGGPPPERGRSSDRSARSRSVHRSTGRPVGSPSVAVAAQSLVDYVRLAALCGLLRCEIAEDPKGNRRRRSMRRMPRELASGSSEKWRRPVSTGVCIPGSGPAANTDDRSTDRQSQCIMRTILRTKSGTLAERSWPLLDKRASGR